MANENSTNKNYLQFTKATVEVGEEDQLIMKLWVSGTNSGIVKDGTGDNVVVFSQATITKGVEF